MGRFDKNLENNGHIKYAEYAQKIKDAKSRAGEYAYVFDFIEKLCIALSFKAELGWELRIAYKKNDKNKLKELSVRIVDAIESVKDFHKAFSYLWHKENKPYGFEIHDARSGVVCWYPRALGVGRRACGNEG